MLLNRLAYSGAVGLKIWWPHVHMKTLGLVEM